MNKSSVINPTARLLTETHANWSTTMALWMESYV
jgi:hypothetical protein